MAPMKVQPIDSPTMRGSVRTADSTKPAMKSRLRRLFDRQFPCVLRVSSAEKSIVAGGAAVPDFEPSSISLANLVQNFIEESNEKQSVGVTVGKFGRNRCNCFNGNSNDSSDDEFDPWNESTTNSAGDSFDIIKSLVPCSSMVERNLLADTAKIVEQQSRIFKRKDELRKLVSDGLSALGYDASICKSRWEKSPSYPAGEYEYVDVVVGGGAGRLLIDVDFRSEFEIARSTGAYKTILQSVPFIFVGKADRLERMVLAVSEAAKQSLKKRGMHIPPWRKADYMMSKWLSPYTRATKEMEASETEDEMIFGEDRISIRSAWQPPAILPRSSERGGAKVVTGLASLLKEKL